MKKQAESVLYREGVRSIEQIFCDARDSDLERFLSDVDKSNDKLEREGRPVDWVRGRRDAVALIKRYKVTSK